jgi:2-polyprenyl-6-methoxyphenol hydroxylase-like FAD-dependent oxidoreductase
LLDRARFPSDTPSTHLIQPGGVRMLQRLGVLEAILGAGAVQLDRLTMVVDDAVRIDAVLDRSNFPLPALCVRRLTLDALLVGAASVAGADVRTGVRVTGLLHDKGRVSGVETATGEKIRATLVVGADGTHSTVAALTGARDYLVTAPRRMFTWAYFDGVTDTHGRVRIGRRGNRALLAAPTDGGLYMASVVSDLADRAAFRADRDGHFMAGISAWPELADVLASGRRTGPIRSVGKWHGYFRESAGPGWALVGDAGHFKDPSPGQGIADAFRQADRLATAIEDGLGHTTLDDTVRRWWRWRDEDAYEMYWFAHDMGAPGVTSPLLTQVLRGVSGDPDATAQLLGVLDHAVRPAQLVTMPRALRAAAAALRSEPRQALSTAAEIIATARREIDRFRYRRSTRSLDESRRR